MSNDAQMKSRKASTCPRCGALNGAGFDRCVRCGQGLSPSAQFRERLGSYFDGDALWASKTIIMLTVIVFAAQVYIGQIRSGQNALQALMRPTTIDAVRFGALHSVIVIAEPWRLLSAVFVHFGTWHLLGNLLFLTWLARAAEPAIGSARFVLAYVCTGIAGFVVSTGYNIFVEGFGGGLTAGASGAVFGITGMVAGMLYRQKNPQWKGFAVQAVLFQLLIGFGINQAQVGIMINNLAHLGGLVVGVAFGFAYATRQRPSRKPTRSESWVNIGALIGLMACVISLVLAQRSPIWRELETRVGGS